jgi:hypothetical protein
MTAPGPISASDAGAAPTESRVAAIRDRFSLRQIKIEITHHSNVAGSAVLGREFRHGSTIAPRFIQSRAS